MIENFKEKSENVKDNNSELLRKILKKTSIQTKNSDDRELFVDGNWKINLKNTNKTIPSNNSNLKRIVSETFSDKKIY